MLTANSLACRRGQRMIFRDLSFTLHAGDVLLITGANGSGKSSLLRVLAGLLPVENGAISWDGKNIRNEPDIYRQSLNYLGHLDAVKAELTAGENLDYWSALHGRQSAANISQDPFGILALRDRPTRYLSAGQKRRLALSRLIFNPAPLWLLDEPLAALDHEGQNILSNCIAQHRRDGGIAVIATHQDMDLPNTARCEMNGSAA